MMPRNGKRGRFWALVVVALFVVAFAALLSGAQQQQQQSVPDAPSVSRNPATLPPLPRANAASPAVPDEPPPTSEPDKAGSSSSLDKKPADTSSAEDTTLAPPGPTTTMTKPGTTPATGGSTNDEVFKLVTNVSFVVVPVTVRDDSGHLVDGLLKRDFGIKEDGVPQNIQFFSSDPFPLSAAVVIDTGLPDAELRKIQETLPALAGAFSAFDEVSVYIFGNSVQQVSDFSAASDKLDSAMRKVRATRGQQGVGMSGGPLGSTSPVVNGKPVDPNSTIQPVVRPESHVLNDAILAAANDLSRRPRSRRRMLFVISDGRELGSRASYQDVLKVLLSHEVAVYPLVVGNNALPVYGTLQKIRIPGQGYGDILPKYASATGTGSVLTEFSAKGIEGAYALATAQARNEYTIGYTTRATATSNYRSVEVVVHRPNLKVYAKDGYYPLPPERTNRPQ